MSTDADGVKPTARPWRAGGVNQQRGVQICADDRIVGHASSTANVAHIVHCVNLHDELIEALEEIASIDHSHRAARIARAALAKVKP